MENVDLTFLQSLVQKASRDIEAWLAATERLHTALELRLGGVGGRITGLEQHVSSLERSMDWVVRSNHRIETILSDIASRLPT